MKSIVVIGGGASGMAAAIEIKMKNPSLAVMLLEKNEILGRKLLATGNGRCNISNATIEGEAFVWDFIHRVGILTRKEDEGRMYPFSGKASDVVASLEKSLNRYEVEIKRNFVVSAILPEKEGFRIKGHQHEDVYAEKVIMAMGGKAAPQFGTSGEGYGICGQLGIMVKPVFPGLTHFQVEDYREGLHGIRMKGSATLLRNGETIAMERGEIQFSKRGLSGILLMNLSSHVVLHGEDNFSSYQIALDFMEGFSLEQVRAIMKQRVRENGYSIQDILATIVPWGLGEIILEKAGISSGRWESEIGTLTGEELDQISLQLKEFRWKVRGLGGWKDAQITVGGVSLNEVTPNTWESHRWPGLYIVGELLDLQGPCGGFNLHLAWKTGIQAANHLVESI